MMNQVLRIARTLSLDIVLGAVISSMFIAEYMNIHLPSLYLFALALSVWIIYTADHLTDASDIPHHAHTYRHHFHQKYFYQLRLLIGIAVLIGIIILFLLPVSLILWGSVVCLFVGVYFASIRWMNLQFVYYKEFIISILYSVGVFLAPVYISHFPPSIHIWTLFIQYILLALANLLIFSWYEKELDIKDLHTSFATLMGDKISKQTIKICLFILYMVFGCSIFVFYSNQAYLAAEAIILAMIITLHTIYLFPSYFRKNELYRSLADAIFLYPAIYLFF